ncbi:MAG: hypothetical protein WD357_08125 [Gracilimonas sp.]
MKTLNLLFFVLLCFFLGTCGTKNKAQENPPAADLPETNDMAPGSLIAEMLVLQVSEDGNIFIEAEIVDIIKYGRQTEPLTKGRKLTLNCSNACDGYSPKQDSVMTALIISSQNMSMEGASSSSWVVQKIY